MEEAEDATLEVTLLSEEGGDEQLFELRLEGLRFFVALDFDDDEGIAYEIFHDPHLRSLQSTMDDVVQAWLHGAASTFFDD